MTWVAMLPGLVAEWISNAGAVIALVEGDGDDAWWGGGGGVAGIPGEDYVASDWLHARLSGEAWVEEPEAGDGVSILGEF